MAKKAGKECRSAFSAMLTDAAAAASTARSVYESLSRIGIVKHEVRSIASTLTSVQDDAVALQLQAGAAYELICKACHLLYMLALPLTSHLLQLHSKPLLARSSGDFI